MTAWALVLAAGSGRRLGALKQFALVGGIRAVDRVVRLALEKVDGVVLVLPDGHVWDGEPVDVVVRGGATRSQSVRSGLSAVPESVETIVIHDTAHPMASPRLFVAVLAAVRDGADAALPALPITESLKRTHGPMVVGNPSKVGLVIAQMPQAFRASVLRRAHASRPEAVEDIELVCLVGAHVVVVAGEPDNLHITTAAELRMADVLAGNG